jgi:phosphoribosyl-AMP cyclohydrolase
MIKLDFEKSNGLIPAVVQDYKSGEVLMLGFMSPESWKKSLDDGEVVSFSRTKKRLWKKGETSGHVQKIKEIYVDCDSDTLLIKVEQIGGAACHTGHRSCFYRRVSGDKLIEEGDLIFDPKEVYK